MARRIRSGAYAISLAVVSFALVACKDDPVTGGDASIADVPGSGAPDAAAADASAPDAEPPPPPAEVCPRANGTPVLGDINGDGTLDIADSTALLDHVFRAGRPPACVAAADYNGDGRVEADDATRIHSLLVSGTQGARTLMRSACASSTTPWPPGRCVPLAWGIDAPARATSSAIAATIAVRSSTLAIGAWSMSVSTTGCTVTAATTEGTSSAEIWDTPPGLRHLGYAYARPVDGGAIAYVMLAHNEDIALPAAAETPLLKLQLQAEVPASGCAQCTLTIDGALRWQGRTIAALVASDGRAYVPESITRTIDVCAP